MKNVTFAVSVVNMPPHLLLWHQNSPESEILQFEDQERPLEMMYLEGGQSILKITSTLWWIHEDGLDPTHEGLDNQLTSWIMSCAGKWVPRTNVENHSFRPLVLNPSPGVPHPCKFISFPCSKTTQEVLINQLIIWIRSITAWETPNYTGVLQEQGWEAQGTPTQPSPIKKDWNLDG